jgi:hypothetical protein
MLTCAEYHPRIEARGRIAAGDRLAAGKYRHAARRSPRVDRRSDHTVECMEQITINPEELHGPAAVSLSADHAVPWWSSRVRQLLDFTWISRKREISGQAKDPRPRR